MKMDCECPGGKCYGNKAHIVHEVIWAEVNEYISISLSCRYIIE